jgi:hypothetical protein
MIAIPVSLASDFIHIAGKSIDIAPEYTIHITGIRNEAALKILKNCRRSDSSGRYALARRNGVDTVH